jgi:dTDP-4-amino-4,6-dideoxygalactose transaminase
VYVAARDRVREELAARGVGTAIHYPLPLHLQAAYRWLGYGPGSFPHAERACERVLSMPLFPEMTDAQVEYAARTLAEIVGGRPSGGTRKSAPLPI